LVKCARTRQGEHHTEGKKEPEGQRITPRKSKVPLAAPIDVTAHRSSLVKQLEERSRGEIV